MKRVVYLDNNATTKVDEKVVEKMLPFFSEYYGNPSSSHAFGGNIMKDIDESREKVKNFLGASKSREIVFTSCGTESANAAIMGILNAHKTKKHIITTEVEHPCVLTLYKILEKSGYRVDYLKVDREGKLLISDLENMITEDTILVSCMMANNETGVIMPYEKVAEIVKEKNKNAYVFVDGVQGAGKIKIDIKNSQVDLLGISGHKFHAPKGVGALYIKSGTVISPYIIGGHQESGKRAGTLNVPYIIGLAEACELADENLKLENSHIKYLRDKLEAGILKNVFNARLNTSVSGRVPNTTNIGFDYVEGELILLHLSDFGICASSGSACTSGSLEPSHVLKAMKVPFTSLHGSIRFSLSRFTTEDDIDYTIEKVKETILKINQLSPFQKELQELKQLKDA